MKRRIQKIIPWQLRHSEVLVSTFFVHFSESSETLLYALNHIAVRVLPFSVNSTDSNSFTNFIVKLCALLFLSSINFIIDLNKSREEFVSLWITFSQTSFSRMSLKTVQSLCHFIFMAAFFIDNSLSHSSSYQQPELDFLIFMVSTFYQHRGLIWRRLGILFVGIFGIFSLDYFRAEPCRRRTLRYSNIHHPSVLFASCSADLATHIDASATQTRFRRAFLTQI